MISFGGPAGTGRYDCGTNAVMDNIDAGTIMWWCRNQDSTPTTTGTVIDKGDATHRWRIRNLTGGNINFIRDRATTDLTCEVAHASFANYPGDGNLVFYAVSWDVALTNTDQHWYCGSGQLAPAEATAYATQIVGSGATQSNAGATLFVGNDAGLVNAYHAHLGPMAVFNRQLSLAEIRSWWRDPRKLDANCVALWQNKVLNVQSADYSGNGNNAQPTGLTYETGFRIWTYKRGIRAQIPAVAGPPGTGGLPLLFFTRDV